MFLGNFFLLFVSFFFSFLFFFFFFLGGGVNITKMMTNAFNCFWSGMLDFLPGFPCGVKLYIRLLSMGDIECFWLLSACDVFSCF